MRPFLFATLAALFLSSFAATRLFVPSSPAGPDAEVVVKQLRAVRVVADRPTVTGYKRERFAVWEGPSDCNTRRKVLVTWFGGSACSLDDGSPREIPDPYTGDPVGAHEVDIDHVYPLAAAWDFGAYAWNAERRRQFGNDIEANLVPTRSAVNRDKGDASPAEWLPEEAESCDYSHRYLTVAIKWDLPVSSADWEAMAAACGIRAGKGTK
ncbi:HNH endonuclease family protein [Corynebacterium vitaeruminis]|uniref:HNH endonuclease family protein n=1 Tax=Corynebacterium vitaeruminis TaxID=38305 RepID=UPI000660C775|nr:HNH endonuclease family protein [Corynebacterium vitaeruminis]